MYTFSLHICALYQPYTRNQVSSCTGQVDAFGLSRAPHNPRLAAKTFLFFSTGQVALMRLFSYFLQVK